MLLQTGPAVVARVWEPELSMRRVGWLRVT
jgi:hypothetical protein